MNKSNIFITKNPEYRLLLFSIKPVTVGWCWSERPYFCAKTEGYLNQNVDISISLVWCYMQAQKSVRFELLKSICRDYDKFSWRLESSLATSGSLKMDSCLVLTECFSRRILRFRTSAIDLIHSERVSTSTSSFFSNRLAYSSHASMIIPKFWCHEYETDSLYFGSLLNRSLRFILRNILRTPFTIWPHGAYRNCESEQLQGRGSWERPYFIRVNFGI